MKKIVSKSLLLLACLSLLAVMVLGCGGNGGNEEAQNGSSGDDKEVAENGDFPTKSVNWIVPFSAGSGADLFVRTLAKSTEKHLGESIVVENKAGGSGSVAISYVLSQPADGYTIFEHSRTLPTVMAKGDLPFTLDELSFIARVNGEPMTLLVNKDSPFETLEDFINHAQENPGNIKLGGTATGGTHHTVGKMFMDRADIDCKWVSYKGGKDAVLGLLSNECDASFITPSNARAQIDEGKIKILAMSVTEDEAKERGVPSFEEYGYELNEVLWRGFFAKEGVPAERLDILNEAIQKGMEEPEWKEYMEKTNQMDLYLPREEFKEYTYNQLKAIKKIVNE